ncbi:hypothetical protein ACHAQI_012355 [Fusarium lateritium]
MPYQPISSPGLTPTIWNSNGQFRSTSPDRRWKARKRASRNGYASHRYHTEAKTFEQNSPLTERIFTVSNEYPQLIATHMNPSQPYGE